MDDMPNSLMNLILLALIKLGFINAKGIGVKKEGPIEMGPD